MIRRMASEPPSTDFPLDASRKTLQISYRRFDETLTQRLQISNARQAIDPHFAATGFGARGLYEGQR